MDLFAQNARKRHIGQPLAERMRPRTLDELVGQAHLVGPGRILGSLAPGRAIPSLIFWSYYSKKIENIAVEMETLCDEFVRRQYRQEGKTKG